MRSVYLLLAVAFVSSVAVGQDPARDQKLAQIKAINSQIDVLNSKIGKIVQDMLLPSDSDQRNADAAGVRVFRLNPRETYGQTVVPQGGGSYYSFTTGSHDYQKTAQISLEQNNLRTGFAGADYGLMSDLGDLPLQNIGPQTPEVAFLQGYKAPGNILDARVEQRRAQEYKAEALFFKFYWPAVVGHTYVLRAITFGEADTLVAFRPVRKDIDGSLIIQWRPLADFDKPQLDPKIREK